jgi:glutamate dehydrogenase
LPLLPPGPAPQWAAHAVLRRTANRRARHVHIYGLSIGSASSTLLRISREGPSAMAVAAPTPPEALMQQVQQGLAADPRAAALAPLLYGSGLGDLAGLGAAWLAANAHAALQFIGTRPKGRHKLYIRRAPSPLNAAAAASVIEIVNDDMPFLVDSALGELQARGLTVRLLLHPILRVKRDRSGHLLAFAAAGDARLADAEEESYIAIHIDPLSEEKARDLTEAISAILAAVRVVVADWRPMLARLRQSIGELERAPASVPADLLQESLAFLGWLERDNFTFLGMQELALEGDALNGDLVRVSGKGLGVLSDPGVHVLRRGTELVAMTPEVRRFFFLPAPLIITKSNVISRVHRRAHMDYVGIKTYHADGTPKGETRIVGLFTSQAYVLSPRQIPFLRHKVATVLAASGFPSASHDGKALLNILETFPRDELFQIGVERLKQFSQGMLDLVTRPRVRLFARVDRFDRFVSAIVYVPRDRFNSGVRERIGALLSQAYKGRVVTYFPYFPAEGPLVRVQFIIGRYSGATPQADIGELERGIGAIVRTWEDRLLEALAALPGADGLRAKYGAAFSIGYQETFPPERALEDIKRIERLSAEQPVAIELYRPDGAPEGRAHAAIYRFGGPISLSERVPVLENLRFAAIDERSYAVTPRFPEGVREVTLHDMLLETADGGGVDLPKHARRLEACFLAVFRGEADNDAFNRLIVAAGADWRETAVLRAYASYLRQLGSPFGMRYVAETLDRHAGVAREFIEMFHVRFDPDRDLDTGARQAAVAPIRERIEGALAGVPSLDEDRILRQLLNLVDATVRCNFYQRDAAQMPPATLAFKFDSKAVEAAPAPRPYREIWVYSPRVEGIHLRFAPIARGGIRWSDRAQDFRTEVLGLVRAQLVKNAVIVPSGAKGGFLPKRIPRSGAREEVQKEGIAAYRIFISALLDITDNIEAGKIRPPARVVRHDGDDPYLVVAADKGTATFSDIANGIAAEHGFWLDDAFASGGSAGYDHKRMAITARGAWVCVRRHFREIDKDIQREAFRVVGVGDMSGDVFGNGMLLSEHIALLAAFDHRDIFIDPAPGPGCFQERARLAGLPRSSWQDFDRSLLSKGGGVFSRSLKAVPLSDEIRGLLEVSAPSLTPSDLMRAILKCRTDLIWFGGIGTYIRASTETDADAGDRANDAIRISAAEVRAKVIGEGANLGVTQRGRIEFAMRGGRINTDFIDNSAGVNTSDQEVNIKIALGAAMRAGKLTAAARNELLAAMTDDVAAASLANNYQQSLALSLAERGSAQELADYALLMRRLEERKLIERALEALPSDAELQERARAGRGLTRPELAELLSYAKIALQHDLLDSQVPDEPEFAPSLIAYFPRRLQERFAAQLHKHSLRREIIALGLTNAIVDRAGPTMIVRLTDETNRTTAAVAHAFLAAREVFELPSLWQRIDALDGLLRGATQLALYQATQDLLNSQTLWFLRDGAVLADLTRAIERHRAGIRALRPAIAAILTERGRRQLEGKVTRLGEDGVPADLAADLAALDVLRLAPAITAIAEETGMPHPSAAAVYLRIGEHLHTGELAAKAARLTATDYYDRLAVTQALAQLSDAEASLTRSALLAIAGGAAGGAEDWLAAQDRRFARVSKTLEEVSAASALTVARLLVVAGQLAELAAAIGGARAASPSWARAQDRSRSAATETAPPRRPARRPRS